ncbi:MAG TPA: hypothetical protein IAA15_07910 [Candidatus Olsenella pullicola]|nr:hypothetical protein [Candidatus Olsenella pullicola]
MSGSIYHTVKLTGIKPGECVVLVRDGTMHYQIGGSCKLHHFGGGVFTKPRDSWSAEIDGCETVYKRTRAEAVKYIAAWWDVHLSKETGRPLDIYAQRRAELAGVGE